MKSVTLYLSTASMSSPDHAEALAALTRLGAAHTWVAPGRPMGDRWGVESARFGDRLALHHACLEDASEPRWNLAAGDEDLRRRAVERASETMRHAAGLGSPFYSVHPGYALALTLDAQGVPAGAEQPRARALDQLCRSLDRLAVLADDLKLGLLVENRAGTRTGPMALPLWQEPVEIHQTLDRLGAPPLGLLLDVGHLLLSCRARHWEPEPVVEELKGRVRAIAVSRNDGVRDGHMLPKEDGIELALAKLAGGLSVPVVLDGRSVEPEALLWARELLLERLTPETPASR